jgi:hypothetical protein
VVDVDCAVGKAPCLTAHDDNGYQIDEAEVAYWGRCPDCQGKSRTTSSVRKKVRVKPDATYASAKTSDRSRARGTARSRQRAPKRIARMK